MEVIPAVDLLGGRCVRLYQGDYERETVYSEDPPEMARRWASQGATRLHVVDLDGARDGTMANQAIVQNIVSSVSVPIQLGGGIRTIELARNAIRLGAARVIIGSAALENPEILQDMCDELGPHSIVVGVDARDGYVTIHGWTQSSRVQASDLVRRMADIGVRRFMYTDVARDGTLTGPNFGAIDALVSQTHVQLIAAGGISSVQHLVQLNEIGVEGAVVGKALYAGTVDLGEALKAVNHLDE